MNAIRTEICEMSFDEQESVLHIRMVEGAYMSLERTKAHYELIRELTKGKKHIALIDVSEYFTIDPESLQYASLPETIGNRIATAYYNPSAGSKLTTDFFRRFYKPPLQSKVFNTKEEAMEWGRQLLVVSY